MRVENFSSTEQGCLLGKAGRTRFYPLYEQAAEFFRKKIVRDISALVALLRQADARVGALAEDAKQEASATDEETLASGEDNEDNDDSGENDGDFRDWV
jgi:CRISPR-associated protein Cas1